MHIWLIPSQLLFSEVWN